MAATSTTPALPVDSDTYRADDASPKGSLKFRIATEYTGNGPNGYSHDGSTNNSAEKHEIRINSQFVRRLPQHFHVIPSVVDEIKQRFSGIVIEVDFDSEQFTARISDLSDPKKPDELVTLAFEEIQDTDARQLAKGDSFLWYIGYVQGRRVSRESFSKIRFRRLPAWSQREVQTASSVAEELLHFFPGHQDTTT